MENINTYCADMPTSIRAYTVLNKDDSYTIILNSRISHEQQFRAYCHEMAHIQNGDYDKKAPADFIEIISHSI